MGTCSALSGCILFILLVLDAASGVVSDSWLVKPSPVCLCPKNEERRCRYPCPPETCVTLYAAFRCIDNQTCVEGCYCKKGFLRIGQKGPCVPRDQCNPLECVNDPNAQRGCGDKCGKTCADCYDKPKVCPKAPCKKDGCECKDGYVYDTNLSLCVKPKDCTKPCRPNERYSTCLHGECVPKICDDLGKPLTCPAIPNPCPGGCICDYGYVKDKNGNCIDAKTCPTCGGDPNAQFGCGNPCGKTCASRYANQSDLICPQYCESNGCDCKKGYLLNTDVKPPRCVLVENCPKPTPLCKNNEEFYCGPSCPDSEASCANPNPPTCINKKCQLKCFCKKGFVRDGNNTCIPAHQCPKQCTKPHERYIGCLAGQCGPKNCSDLDRPIACPLIRGPCPGGCICEEGYLRNAEGNCVKLEKCPAKTCRANETWTSPCNAPCPYPRCPRNDQPQPACVPIQPCYPGCQCKLNYLRNSTGNCILAPECPPVKCTRQYELWDNCPSTCLAESCDDVNNQPKVCNTLIWLCSPRCVCKKGHFRNKDGLCVPASQCPSVKCTKPNEQYIDCLAGQCKPKTCSELITPAPCPEVRPPCPGGCICVEGYVRNVAGDCIKKEKCPKRQCKGPHEKYIDCPAGQCNPKTCDDLVTPPGCPRVIPPCPGGCVCEEGYLRDLNGTCIKKEQCPSTQCNKPNERYSNCLLGECVPKRCADVGFPVACPDIVGPCAGGCTCIEGYVRDSKGNCIDMKKCPSCGGDLNAVSGCGNPCGKTCASLYANKSDLICPQYCEYNGCDCKPGYRLLSAENTDSKKCIPERECPKPPQQCDKNEQYYCGTSCPEATCANPTPPICVNKKCKFGCFCKKGFVRNGNNKCIPIGKCPPQPQCKGPNERYIDCPAGQCNPKTCQDLITTPPCPRVRPPCPGGCVCVEGYLRDYNGKCIKKELCPQFSCTANQTYVTCNINCTAKNCPKDDRLQPICEAPRYCPPGCTCKINYRYDESGNCILASECPPVNCTGKNMEWNSCPSDCLAEQCEDADSQATVCNTLLLNCQPRCVCKPGHFKNSDGVCVPARECPSVCKDPNASWKDCKDACPATCQNTRPNCVNIMCSPGCQCNDGYVLSKLGGKCVKIETCADYANCGCNQTFVPCTFKCPQVTCPKSDQTILCKPPRDCPGGCGCKPYYRYNATGDCVKASDCPPIKCTRPNEQFTCQRVYAWERCEDRNNSPPFNPGHPDDCTPKCVCKTGFWRNDANKCVPAYQCPP